MDSGFYAACAGLRAQSQALEVAGARHERDLLAGRLGVEVDHDGVAREECIGGECVHDPVGADLLWIVDMNRDSRLDAGLDEQRFDSEVMLQGLRSWVECESPTFDASAVNRMLDVAAREMAIMGASIE